MDKIFLIDDFKRKLKSIEDAESVLRSLIDLGMTEDAARLYVAGYTSAMAKVEEMLAKSYLAYPTTTENENLIN